MTREELINEISIKGWNEETKQLTREVFVNEPTNRLSFYDFSTIFKDENVSAWKAVNIVKDCLHYEKKQYRYGYKNVLLEKDHLFSRYFNNQNELIEFWNGTSFTRAQAFLKNGDGYTELEYPVQLHTGAFSGYGIQVMLKNSRARDYAHIQANATQDCPVILHGFIKAKYLYPGNNGYEYCIPCEYYNKIEGGDIEKIW